MPDQRRLTKDERRRLAREERRLKELAAKKRARRNRIVGIAATIGIGGLAVGVLVLTRGPGAPPPIELNPEAVELAREEAGCVEVQQEPQTSSPHLDPAVAPEATVLYTEGLPTSTGLHFGSVASVGVFTDPPDERSTTHNLEHGSVIAWYAGDNAEGADLDAAATWARSRAAAGFDVGGAVRVSGAGIIVAPYEDQITSGKVWAFRAWQRAMDCDRFDTEVADAYLLDNWGSHGISPEGSGGAPFPEGAISYQLEPEPGPSSSGSARPTEPSEAASASDEPTVPASDEPTAPSEPASSAPSS